MMVPPLRLKHIIFGALALLCGCESAEDKERRQQEILRLVIPHFTDQYWSADGIDTSWGNEPMSSVRTGQDDVQRGVDIAEDCLIKANAAISGFIYVPRYKYQSYEAYLNGESDASAVNEFELNYAKAKRCVARGVWISLKDTRLDLSVDEDFQFALEKIRYFSERLPAFPVDHFSPNPKLIEGPIRWLHCRHSWYAHDSQVLFLEHLEGIYSATWVFGFPGADFTEEDLVLHRAAGGDDFPYYAHIKMDNSPGSWGNKRFPPYDQILLSNGGKLKSIAVNEDDITFGFDETYDVWSTLLPYNQVRRDFEAMSKDQFRTEMSKDHSEVEFVPERFRDRHIWKSANRLLAVDRASLKIKSGVSKKNYGKYRSEFGDRGFCELVSEPVAKKIMKDLEAAWQEEVASQRSFYLEHRSKIMQKLQASKGAENKI